MTQSGDKHGTRSAAPAPATGRVIGVTIRQSAEQIIEDVPFFGRMAKDPKTRSLLLDGLAAIVLPEAMALELSTAHDTQHEVYLHLVRTALTASWLARTPALTRCDAGMAATAGLLHDIGMLHVDPRILDPDHVLTAEQRRQLYAHSLMSTTMLERHAVYPAEVVRAVSEHHECLDGSGYPRNLVGDAISPLGKVLSLAQVVAAMFAPGRSSPEMRLSVLLRMTWHRYDNAMGMQVLSLLKPQLDVMSAELQLLDDPISHLCEISRLLRQWPLRLGAAAALTPARLGALETLATYATQMQRVLAGVGAVPEQLKLLTVDAQDNTLLAELTLLTREASWQLGTLARQTRRRWNAQANEAYPPVLQQWLSDTEALLAAVSGVAPGSAAAPVPPGPAQ
jgi:putative nucleotidyltransferase with HDIG domain